MKKCIVESGLKNTETQQGGLHGEASIGSTRDMNNQPPGIPEWEELNLDELVPNQQKPESTSFSLYIISLEWTAKSVL